MKISSSLELYTAQQTREIGTKRRPYVKNTAQSSANGLASGGSEAASEGSASWSVIPCFTPHILVTLVFVPF